MSVAAKAMTLEAYLHYDDGTDTCYELVNGAYWIVDPIAGKVTVLQWVDGLYEDRAYENEQGISSTQLPDAQLIAAAILSAGR